ncbi:hypothetical protein [Sphingomonas sp.]|jgi:hypothetical protein|uniref:hypothetical protein n=1 Tax=Sphingomonas sp. TaxID=28214 RepID=UPI002EDAD8E7
MFYDRMLGADYSASPAPVGFAGTLLDVAAPLATKANATVPQPFKRPKGEWFDEDFDFIGSEGDAFTEMLLAAIDAVEVRDRKRKVHDLKNHRIFIRKLAVNGFRAFRWFTPPLVAVMTGPKDYKGRGEPWLNGEAMGREIKLLRDAGMIESSPGIWRKGSTTFRPTEAFVIAAMNAKLSDRNVIHRLDPGRLIRVYQTSSGDGNLIDFAQDDQSRAWRAKIDAYNGFIAQQDIGIALSSGETAQLTARMNAQRQAGTPKLKRPDLTNKSLYRQFNNGGFEDGGRFYGAWWVNFPKGLRPLITINGEPTVELDFASCAIRMLYHKNGLPFEGDAYFLDALEAIRLERRLPEKFFRPGTKRFAQALFNTTKEGCPERVKLTGEERVRPWVKEAAVVAMLRDKHAPIAHEFQSEAWKWLQRKDSEIALNVISNLEDKGIVALPVHDSFVVVDGQEDA